MTFRNPLIPYSHESSSFYPVKGLYTDGTMIRTLERQRSCIYQNPAFSDKHIFLLLEAQHDILSRIRNLQRYFLLWHASDVVRPICVV